MTTDGELLQRYATANSEAAFAELVQRHLGMVYAAALRQLGGDAHLAQDVSQTVFTALARKAPALGDRASLAGWLYLGTHHAAAQVVRADQRRRTREQEAHTMHEILTPDGVAADWDRIRPILDEALRALNDTDREAVLLRYFERRPFADIGAALALSEDAARMRVERSLEKLRVLLSRRGIGSTAAALSTLLAEQAVIAAPAGLAATITGTALNGGATALATAFMSTPVIVSAVIALGALGTALFQFNDSRSARAALAEVTRERAGLQARLREVERRGAAAEARAVAAEDQGTALKQQLSAASAPKLSLLATAPAAAPAPSVATKGFISFRASPELEGLDPAERKRRVQAMNLESWDSANDALYRLLGFNAVQREQFRALRGQYMVRQDDQVAAAMKSAMAQIPKPDRAAMQLVFDAEVRRSHADWLAAVGGAFGEPVVQTVQRYYDSVPARAVTTELAGSLFYSDAPLTIAQAEQLVDIIARHSRNSQGKVDLGAMNQNAIATDAASALSTPQVAALRRAMDAMQRKWAPEAGATATPAGPRS
ncbi:MAG TPA: sigma-70 family RNA polymerase sigma factor [Opitutaceae bacterium]|nr:sigma-70 family RNA polymerase sigma factor [Opitutaceae bacterium]